MWAFARLRPFRILAAVTLVAILAGQFLERGISYDDGGIGFVVFLLYYVLLSPALFLNRVLAPLGPTFAGVGLVVGILALLALYIWLDHVFTRWAKVREVKRRLTSA
jgi:hypothetical protein